MGHRHVRVYVTVPAAADLKMRLPFVARDTGSDRVFCFRRMSRMAIEATDFCRVFTAISDNHL
ncbi:MAG: hypothetical protein DRH08_01115 [Deltaproteobacteria bacterium]|nr:MAG: hypothetical protein DRH08_01115 [Deltaproteobacteria bacterium]